MFTMLHSLATTLLIRIPVTVFVGSREYATLELMGLAAPLSTLGSLVLCLLYLRHLKKRQQDRDRIVQRDYKKTWHFSNFSACNTIYIV